MGLDGEYGSLVGEEEVVDLVPDFGGEVLKE